METNLKDQVALVTGAASGIGLAYTRHLLQNQVKVAMCDLNLENCQRAANDFASDFNVENILVLQCDVTDQEQFENAFKSCISRFKRLDIVINNAGVFDETMENWHTTMNINYGGVVRGTMLAIKYTGTPNGGKGCTVVQTASITAFMSKCFVGAIYASSKRAVVEYTRSIGDERSFKYLNIRVMALCPGFVDTPLIRGEKSKQFLIRDFADIAKSVINTFPVQTPNNVGKALIHILKQGKTGDCWIVENEEPPKLAIIPNVLY